jgi:hypothetical protein
MGLIEVKVVEPLVTDWLIAIGTIGVAIIALFQDKIRALLQRPKLDVSVNVAPPDCHKTPVYLAFSDKKAGYLEADSYYFRLRVKNSGNQKGEFVEVVASELSKEQDGSFKKIENFPLMNLLWTHIRKPYFNVISPDMEKLFDLGHIIDPSQRERFGEMENDPNSEVTSGETIFSFDFEVKKTGMVHLIPKGKYHLKLQVGAANSKPKTKTLEINFSGKWSYSERQMLSEGIEMRIL